MFVRPFVALAAFVALLAGVNRLPATGAPGAAATAGPKPSPAGLATPGAIPSPTPEPGATAGTVSAAATGSPANSFAIALPSPGAAQNYATFERGAEHLRGVIDLLRKDDDLYFDLGPASFDRTYIIAPSLSSGVGSGAFAGRVYEPFLVRFKRVGHRVLWISPNTHFTAAKGSAAANSLAVSVADSVLFSTPIVAEDQAKMHVVVAPSLFLSDFEGIGADLGRGVTPPSLPGLILIGARASFSVDASKSYYVSSKTFPRNDEISVNLTFNGPPNALPTVPDGRGIPVVVHYSIVTPPDPDPNFVPRYADDRVGYFITARKSFGDDAQASPFERFIQRWNLDNGPIVFYLTNEIPAQYRATVRRGLLAWNDAFARAGRPDAIVVKDQPADPNWDADDARYSTVRWITSDRPEFAAYSPSVIDPNTGQIIRAEVVIDGESLRAVKRGYVDVVLPLSRGPADVKLGAADCEYQAGAALDAALGSLELAADPNVSAAKRERYAQAWLYATVLHEVGHTLGLRHNFAGSTAYTPAQLHDPAFTGAHGTTASVMDYTPVNLAAPGKRQADYFTKHLGPYDYWAIDYGYRRFGTKTSAAELPYLHQIAARSTQPGLAYGTDEDALDPYALDPRIARFDLSSDPLAEDAERLALDEHLAALLDRPYRGDARSYADLRQSLFTILNNELSTADLAAHYVGGIYTSRSHRGQAGGVAPFESIPKPQARRAFDLLQRYVFSARAFDYSPNVLNELEGPRFGFHWDSTALVRQDFPFREIVAEVQDQAIATIFSPPNLARIADQQLKARPGETMTLGDLFRWMNAAVYDDLGARSIAPVHRDLQRRYADLMTAIAVLPSFALDAYGLPRDVQAEARATLRDLDRRLPAALAAARDPATHAYLEELRSRVSGVLSPTTLRAI
jgi:hypothetical protein